MHDESIQGEFRKDRRVHIPGFRGQFASRMLGDREDDDSDGDGTRNGDEFIYTFIYIFIIYLHAKISLILFVNVYLLTSL